MANKIIIKKSSVATKVPAAGDLEVGELAVNLTDQKLYSKNAGGTVILVGSGLGGSGDVQGPASATDNAIARYDGTTGKIIQNSVVSLSDTGVMTGVTLDSYLNDVGADHVHYKIKALESLTPGSIVKYAGWNAGENAVEVYKVSSSSDVAIGICHDTLATGAFGLAVVQGAIEGLDTSSFTQGTILYPNTSGGLTSTKPTSGTYQACAFVLRSQAVNGALLVSFSNPQYVEASANTANTAVIRDGSGNFSAGTITAALNGNASTATSASKWTTARNLSLTGDVTATLSSVDGTGDVSAAATLANSGVTAGSYTNASVTVDAKGRVTSASNGTAPVTSVSGTAPISSSGGATPAISISQASSTTNGYLSSTDWNTFNNKTSNTGTVTSVSMTVPTGLSISGSPITTSGTLALTLTAGYSIPTTASQSNWDSAYSQRLQWDGGSTNLVAATGRTSLGATTLGSNLFTITNPSAVTFPRFNADNTVSALDATTFRSAIGAGTGTVTSVSATAPVASSGGNTPVISLNSGYGDSQNPYASKTANYFLAAPNGAAGAPTFRAIVAADIPTLNQSTTGNASTATLATKASTLSQGGGNGTAMTFNWSGQSGQPSWLWGSNDGSNIYVWNPSNFSVNYANTAGSAPANGGTSAACSGNSATATKLTTAGGSAPSYSARAWVNFNGTGTVAIRSSGNVSSITDNGVGNYTVNFSTAMQDANYALTGSSGDGVNANQMFILGASVNYSTGSCQIRTGSGGGYNDNAYVNVLIHR